MGTERPYEERPEDGSQDRPDWYQQRIGQRDSELLEEARKAELPFGWNERDSGERGKD